MNTYAASKHRSENGLLLVGHGTRDAEGLREMLAVCELVARSLPEVAVEPCFLELAQPNIAQGLAAVTARGVKQLTVMPLLLFSAGHARRDIPATVAQAAKDYPGLEIRQTETLGCEPALLELSKLRYLEALAGRPEMAPEQTLLLMVGRGSYEAEANAEMAKFARLRWEGLPVGWLELSFTAMTRPLLSDALPKVAALGFPRIVVQPHLLFSGELLSRVTQETASFAESCPDQQYIVTGQLGVHQLLAEAIVAKVSIAIAACR